MLTLFRRHLKTCKFKAKGRKHRSCKCPISVEGTIHGEFLRKSLDLRNWEAATARIRDWELEGTAEVVTTRGACERFMADRKALKIGASMLGKYTRVTDEIIEAFGDRPLTSITTDEIRRIREGWSFAPVTTQKRLEMLRSFFTFCVDSNWIDKSPAKAVKGPVVEQCPTLPFTDLEMEKIIWAAESIREAHPKISEMTAKKLKALVLLMRYSGIRISDAAMFQKRKLVNNKLFLRQEKTGQPVWVPLEQYVVDAILECEEGSEYFFYGQVGTKKSCITEWQQRLRLVYDMAGLPDGHSHRLRDTFAVDLLLNDVPIEKVSKLLGHKSIKVTQEHYSPWVLSLQEGLEEAVRRTWVSA